MIDFHKTIGGYSLHSHRTSDSLVIVRQVNMSVKQELTLWQTEDIHDVYYAIGRFLALRKEEEERR